MDHQDWNTVVFKKPEKKPKIVNHNLPKKVDDNEGPVKPKTYSADFVDQVKKYRQSHELTQKQLATKINVKEDIIKNLEAGKGVYDPKVVTLIKRLF